MIILKDKNTYILRLKRGEYVIKSLEKLAIREKLKSASFTAIGALDQVELAHYNVAKKKYSSKKFNSEMELVNMTGNISWYDGKPLVHAHASLSNPDMSVVGGHFVEGRVSGTCEISLNVLGNRIEKQYDPETGLKLMVP
ncbi:DNA-binding protein [Candidatus Gottesmanbacteria bacterium]|nr:DNA-binding protein [Candidatus Gottesmanbacteria bacterium]